MTDGDRDTDVVEIRLSLRADADVRGAVDGAVRFTCISRNANEREGEALLCFGEKLFDAPAIDEIFETGFFAVGAICVLGEDANHGGSDGYRLVGSKKDAAIAGELLVACDATEMDAEVHSGGDALIFLHLHGDEADVVGIRDDADGASVVEGDVELAWEAVHIVGVEDVVAHRFGERGDIVELGWIKACDRRCGDVADVVGTGAARGHAKCMDFVEHADDVFGLELTDLKVAAGGDVGSAGAPVGGHFGEAAKLMRGEDGAGNAEAEHEGVLRGGDVEEAVKLEAKEIVWRGGFVFVCVREKLVPDVEGVLFVFPTLLFAEIGDEGSEVGLLRDCGLVGQSGGRIVGDLAGAGVAYEGDWAALGYACKEALKVLLLLCGEAFRIGCNLSVHGRRSLYEVSTHRVSSDS